MNRITRFLVAGAVTGAAGISASGCVDNNETLFINGVLALTPPTCIYDPDPTQPILFQGTLDLLFKHSYSAGILVGNQYTPRGVKQNLKAESTRITLRGAEIALTDSVGTQIQCTGAPNCGSFTVYGTGFVDTNRAEEPAWGFFGAELIPESVGTFIGETMRDSGLISKTVYASVRVFGESLGGQEVTSSELTFPIKLCTGCLIDYPLVAIEGGQCVVSPSNLPTDKPCVKGQDTLVDCRYCADGKGPNSGNPCNTPPPSITQ